MRPKLFLIIATVITLLFAFAIAIDISPYLRGPAPYAPDWRWEYNFVNTYPKMWAPILVATSIIFLFYKVEKKNWIAKYKGRILLLFASLSYILQFALLFANRAGINGLLSRIINPDVNGYFTTALTVHNISDFLKDYNSNVLSFSMHAQGHPPFAILFFYWIDQFFKAFTFLNNFVSNISPNTQQINLIWTSLLPNEKLSALFLMLFIPLLVSVTSILLYFVAEKLYDAASALRALTLYIFIPSVLLFIPINDSFISLFPLLSLLILIGSFGTKSRLLVLLSGLVFSVGIYFSISLLPLILIFIWLVVPKLKFKTEDITKFLFFFLLGNLLIPTALWVLFKFDSIKMIQVLMMGLPESRNYTTWVLYNLYDFFVFIGIPLTIAFIILFYRTSKTLLTKRWEKIDPLFLSFSLMLLIVNFSGSVKGEVARIWIPFVPFFILAIISSFKKIEFSTKKFILLLVLQILLILAINEYWVTFW